MGVPTKRYEVRQAAVDPVSRQELRNLYIKDPEISSRWLRVEKWLTDAPVGVKKERAYEARMTDEEIKIMVALGHAEYIDESMVRATVNVFPVSEEFKKRSRLIKHTKAFNDAYGKEFLVGIKMIKAKDLVRTVHDGTYAICMDFTAWFDQLEVEEAVRNHLCFTHNGRWYRLTRLPMGMRTSVDVAHTLTEMLLSYDRAPGVRADAYVDNVRFLGLCREEVIAAAAEFIRRCRQVGATIGELSKEKDRRRELLRHSTPDGQTPLGAPPPSRPGTHPPPPGALPPSRPGAPPPPPPLGAPPPRPGPADETPEEAAERLLSTHGEFLGAEFDYHKKTVKVGVKTIAKLAALKEVFDHGVPTHRNLLALFGLLFFTLQITKEYSPHRYYALKEYSETARRLQRDPCLLETPYKCAPSRMACIMKWMGHVLANEPVSVPVGYTPEQARYVLVTDASKKGWGALLLDMHDGMIYTRQGIWSQHWDGRNRSAWAEPEAIAKALLTFFPSGTHESIAVLSDSTTAVGAFSKGRSMKYSVNRSIDEVFATFGTPNATFHHIDGKSNIHADFMSRDGKAEDVDVVAAKDHILKLLMGLSPKGVPTEKKSVCFEDKGKSACHLLWEEKMLSTTAPIVMVV